MEFKTNKESKDKPIVEETHIVVASEGDIPLDLETEDTHSNEDMDESVICTLSSQIDLARKLLDSIECTFKCYLGCKKHADNHKG